MSRSAAKPERRPEEAAPGPLWRRLLRYPRSDRERWRFALFLGLTLALVFFVVREIYGPGGYLVWRQQRSEYRARQRRVLELERQGEAREKWNERLRQGDPAAIERVARDQRMARPNETVYTLPDQDKPAHPPAAENANPK
ncbi:MAG TPA: septum formation initiator family protein [Terriglobia bacterium]|nr:septum formation initiator family protein [Terriglobia bacterium]